MRERVKRQIKRVVSCLLALAIVIVLVPVRKAQASTTTVVLWFVSSDSCTVSGRTYYTVTPTSTQTSVKLGDASLTFVMPTVTPKSGYQFSYWTINSDNWTCSQYAITNISFPVVRNETVTYIIRPVALQRKYAVNFMDGSTVLSKSTVTNGGKVARPSNPTKSGYTFEGWYRNRAFTAEFSFNTAIYSDIEVYAKFVKNSDTGGTGGSNGNGGSSDNGGSNSGTGGSNGNGGSGGNGNGSGSSGGTSSTGGSAQSHYGRTVRVGNSFSLSPQGSTDTGGDWRWDNKYLRKDAAGKFTALKTGDTTVTQTLSGKEYTYNIKVVSKTAAVTTNPDGSAPASSEDKDQEGQAESLIRQFVDTDRLGEVKDISDIVSVVQPEAWGFLLALACLLLTWVRAHSEDQPCKRKRRRVRRPKEASTTGGARKPKREKPDTQVKIKRPYGRMGKTVPQPALAGQSALAMAAAGAGGQGLQHTVLSGADSAGEKQRFSAILDDILVSTQREQKAGESQRWETANAVGTNTAAGSSVAPIVERKTAKSGAAPTLKSAKGAHSGVQGDISRRPLRQSPNILLQDLLGEEPREALEQSSVVAPPMHSARGHFKPGNVANSGAEVEPFEAEVTVRSAVKDEDFATQSGEMQENTDKKHGRQNADILLQDLLGKEPRAAVEQSAGVVFDMNGLGEPAGVADSAATAWGYAHKATATTAAKPALFAEKTQAGQGITGSESTGDRGAVAGTGAAAKSETLIAKIGKELVEQENSVHPQPAQQPTGEKAGEIPVTVFDMEGLEEPVSKGPNSAQEPAAQGKKKGKRSKKKKKRGKKR